MVIAIVRGSAIETQSHFYWNHSRMNTIIKKFGAAAFLFFLIKGLLWLIVPAVLAYAATT